MVCRDARLTSPQIQHVRVVLHKFGDIFYPRRYAQMIDVRSFTTFCKRRARESTLHVLAEQYAWLKKHCLERKAPEASVDEQVSEQGNGAATANTTGSATAAAAN